MPADASNSVPKARRLTVRRLLLAILLGLAAWWGVGWWLSPRPLFALAYPATKRFVVTPFDTEGRLVLVATEPGENTRVRLDVLELASGWVVTAYSGESVYQFPGGTIQVDHELIKTAHGPGGGVVYAEGTDEQGQKCLWAWDLLRDERRVVRSPVILLQEGRLWGAQGTLGPSPPGVLVSRDGCTLVEAGAVPASPWLALMAAWGGLDAVVARAASVACPIGPVHDVYLVSSMPSGKIRSVVAVPRNSDPTDALPWEHEVKRMKRRPAVLSADGRWLVCLNDELPGIAMPYAGMLPLSLRAATRRGYRWMTGPNWVCDTITGTVKPVTEGPTGSYWRGGMSSEYHRSKWQGVLVVEWAAQNSKTEAGREPISTTRYLHAPSRRWLDGDPEGRTFREAASSTGTVRWISLSVPGIAVSRIDVHETNAAGETRTAGSLDMARWTDVDLVDNASQAVVTRLGEDPLKWLADWWPKGWSLPGWLQKHSSMVEVMDYERGRTLLSLSARHNLDEGGSLQAVVVPGGGFLLVKERGPEGHVLTVLRLPLVSWSPWWSRSVGLLIAALVLFSRRRRPAYSPS